MAAPRSSCRAVFLYGGNPTKSKTTRLYLFLSVQYFLGGISSNSPVQQQALQKQNPHCHSSCMSFVCGFLFHVLFHCFTALIHNELISSMLCVIAHARARDGSLYLYRRAVLGARRAEPRAC
jgi:hypothetical protein